MTTATNTKGVPARFDPSAQRRRALLGKVHLGAKELKLAGDRYVDMLFGVTGKGSARDCSDAELVAVVERLKALGWKPAAPKGRTGDGKAGSRPADHPAAMKARALWISLHHLGAIDNPSELALEAFARRQLKVERLQWANQREAFRLIEALKAIAERHGWSQSTEGVAVAAVPVVLRRRLVEAIMAELKRIGLIPNDWGLKETAWRLAGIGVEGLLVATASQLDAIAKALGDKLREARPAMGEVK